MTTQPKKPARRIFDAPVRYRAGVPQITRRFFFPDTPFGAIPAKNLSWIDITDAIANNSTSSKVLFSCKENPVSAAAVKAGTLNAVADISPTTLPRISASRFELFFCDPRPDFL